jgi:hypothetical protein
MLHQRPKTSIKTDGGNHYQSNIPATGANSIPA